MSSNAIISVYDKTDLKQFAEFLLNKNVNIYSSGGTHKTLLELNNPNIFEISSLTEFPEILDGRVKTLHPKIHGGILAKNTEKHSDELKKLDIPSFDIVVANLYPFQQVINNPNSTEDDIIENIDIGGHTLIRAAAKNHQKVLVITNPSDYKSIKDNWAIIPELRKTFAKEAFQYITKYDIAINKYFNPDIITKQYTKECNLKYGLNPQQKFAGLYKNIDQNDFPLKILNGNPGYINFLDAVYGYNLVNELKQTLNMVAVASYKHTSPAGVGLNIDLDSQLRKTYLVLNQKLTPQGIAYIRARNADPLCSFGDFIACNEKVDVCMAKMLSKHVSDGIIAPDYEPDAFEILKNKKKGSYVVLKANKFSGSDLEIRELHGITFIQESNKKVTTIDSLQNIVTENKTLTNDAIIDLILANTTAKYTQSNTIVAAYNGQVIAVGAGQQSRIDCMKLVKTKVINWYMRQHPKCLDYMNSLENMTHQDKINAIIKFVTDDLKSERDIFINSLSGVSVASDAFFPFTDNIEVAFQFGCKFIIQPGGSIADNEITNLCNKNNMVQCLTGNDMRMFLH